VQDFIPGTLAINFDEWLLNFSAVPKPMKDKPKPERAEDGSINIPIANAIQLDLTTLFAKMDFIQPKTFAGFGFFSQATANNIHAGFYGKDLTIYGNTINH
jgi:hypothetical protein